MCVWVSGGAHSPRRRDVSYPSHIPPTLLYICMGCEARVAGGRHVGLGPRLPVGRGLSPPGSRRAVPCRTHTLSHTPAAPPPRPPRTYKGYEEVLVPAAPKAPPPAEGELVNISDLEEWAQVGGVGRGGVGMG